MNPTEAGLLANRVAELKKRAYALDNVTSTDPDCVRLRMELRLAESRARTTVTLERGVVGNELQRATAAITKWERSLIDVNATEQPLDAARAVRMTLVDRIERPRVEHGSDWSNTRIVLARYGPLELLWLRSGKHWGDILSGHVSHGGSLLVSNFASERSRQAYKYLSEDGRLSRGRLLEFAGRINAFFGIPDVAENLNWKKTLLIEDLP